jgi:hypothetical protein
MLKYRGIKAKNLLAVALSRGILRQKAGASGKWIIGSCNVIDQVFFFPLRRVETIREAPYAAPAAMRYSSPVMGTGGGFCGWPAGCPLALMIVSNTTMRQEKRILIIRPLQFCGYTPWHRRVQEYNKCLKDTAATRTLLVWFLRAPPMAYIP